MAKAIRYRVLERKLLARLHVAARQGRSCRVVLPLW
jgi:hypothetical protein